MGLTQRFKMKISGQRKRALAMWLSKMLKQKDLKVNFHMMLHKPNLFSKLKKKRAHNKIISNFWDKVSKMDLHLYLKGKIRTNHRRINKIKIKISLLLSLIKKLTTKKLKCWNNKRMLWEIKCKVRWK